VIGGGVLLGIAVAIASLAWDPSAYAAEPKRALGLLIALVAAAFAVVNARDARARAPGGSPRRLSWAWRLGLGFVALSALSALWGLPSGRLELATWVGAVACGAAAAQAGRASAIRTARTAAILTGGACAVWALAAFAFGARGFAVHAGQGNPNWLGLLLATTLPLSLESAVAQFRRTELSPRKSLALAALASLQIAALYASHSRVAWVAAAVAGTWLAWCARRVPGAARAGAAILALGAILTAGIVVLERAPRTPHPLTSSAPVASPEDVPAPRSLEGRLWIAKQSLRAARDAGPLGAGLGRFGHVYLDAQGAALARLDVRAAARRFVNAGTAHDEPLQVAVESGPLAALLLLAALALAFRDARRARWHAGSAVLVATAISMLGDSPLRQPATCLVVALVMAACTTGRRMPAGPSARRSFAFACGLALLAGLLLWSTRAWLSTHYRGTPALALRLDPDSADAQLAQGLEELALGRPKAALPRLERANHLGGALAARLAIGEAWLARDAPEEAREALRAALVWHPGSLRARIAMAEAERRLGHLDEAERHSRAAHAVSPGDPHVAELVSRLSEARMDRDAQDR